MPAPFKDGGTEMLFQHAVSVKFSILDFGSASQSTLSN
ncbi:hypothetical protein EBBID32_960 [Sphingobium indicum BiD32]|uniref:Uncharacterized protein n=1 Tax=Sphingobium indicum BiD32 TaxID=1301087 RepID=N1MK35_9SPHN|nr:hypothetical protein EBBID32_960 [Sphingobium indicum BiD32]